MPARSAGVMLYRQGLELEVLLVHPGGPFWRNRDKGAWQIPKGEVAPGETDAIAARREAEEELGLPLPDALTELGEIRQAGGKLVMAFAAEHDVDPARIVSNTFSLEWPPRSGRLAAFPEIDAARWMTIGEAREMILPSQVALLDRLLERLSAN
jgi:predicted NUDIX family NTP pyrophosphohydrolase